VSDKDSGPRGAYREAGVDIDAQDRALARVKEIARATHTDGVLNDIGAFGGLFEPPATAGRPVLVASADGVGTKMMVARMMGDYSTVGLDLVNHCVNDIMVQGAEPLFFLDYVAAGTLDPDAMVELVSGVARGCRENRCALLGGETAEMPDMYQPGDYDLAGFIVGQVDRERILDGSGVEEGDALVGLASNGLHTNGYTLARKVFFERLGLAPGDPVPGSPDDTPIGERLLRPHLSYRPALDALFEGSALHGAAHVTGGGLTDNLPRVVPDGLRARIDPDAWQVPEIFDLLERHGRVEREEMFRVFNMGIGMVLIVAAGRVAEVIEAVAAAGYDGTVVGEIERGDGGTVFEESAP
jgi:phosphoribosylformylglycinamidine cyclo-ligase